MSTAARLEKLETEHAELSARLLALEFRLNDFDKKEEPVSLFVQRSASIYGTGPNPESLSMAEKAANKLSSSLNLKMKDDVIDMKDVTSLLKGLETYAEEHGNKLPYSFALDNIDARVRDDLITCTRVLKLGKPTNAKEWYDYLVAYRALLGPSLTDVLATVKPMDIHNDALTLENLMRALARTLEHVKLAVETANKTSLIHADARFKLTSATASLMPAAMRSRFYRLLGISPADDPPATLTLEKIGDTMYTALDQLWVESARESKQASTFVFKKDKEEKAKEDKADKASASKPAPTSKAAPTNNNKTEKAPKAGAGAGSAGAGTDAKAAKSDDGFVTVESKKKSSFTKPCWNCDSSDHKPHLCPKPCKWHEAGKCKHGRQCSLGPVVPGTHGDMRKKPESD